MREPNRIPEGIEQCPHCGEYRGRCRAGDLDWGHEAEDLEEFSPELAERIAADAKALRPPDHAVITVSCLCTGIVCPRCKKSRLHRPISNAYDPERNAIVHYPFFHGAFGCDACAARRDEGGG